MDTMDRVRALADEAGWSDQALIWLLVRFIHANDLGPWILRDLAEEVEAERLVDLPPMVTLIEGGRHHA